MGNCFTPSPQYLEKKRKINEDYEEHIRKNKEKRRKNKEKIRKQWAKLGM